MKSPEEIAKELIMKIYYCNQESLVKPGIKYQVNFIAAAIQMERNARLPTLEAVELECIKRYGDVDSTWAIGFFECHDWLRDNISAPKTEQASVPSDCVDAYRKWERNHNRDNYGRYDAWKAGATWAIKSNTERPEVSDEKINEAFDAWGLSMQNQTIGGLRPAFKAGYRAALDHGRVGDKT